MNKRNSGKLLFLLPKRKSPTHMSKKLSVFCLHSTFLSNFKAIDIDSIAKVDYTLKPQIITSQMLQEDSSSFFHVFQLSLFCTQSGLEFDPYFQRIHYIKLLYALFAQSRQAKKKKLPKASTRNFPYTHVLLYSFLTWSVLYPVTFTHSLFFQLFCQRES